MATIHSMTGFATRSGSLQTAHATIPCTLTIKSVNGRFFEATYKMPHLCAGLEPALTRRAKDALVRGTVTISLSVQNISLLKGDITLSRHMAESYIRAAQQLKTEFHINGDIDPGAILAFPGIFEYAEEQLDESARTFILQLADTALEDLIAMRAQEGTTLVLDIQKRLAHIAATMDSIEPRAREVAETRKQEFMGMLQEMLNAAPQEVRAQHLQALYTTIERMDVHEEIVRIRSHIDAFKNIIADDEISKGKRLDFLTQELAREANTINSKISDTGIIHHIVGVKSEIERIREQVQNIV